jgi:hypothetical protein
MITHLSVIGDTAGQVSAEVWAKPIGDDNDGDMIALRVGAGLVIHLDVAAAEIIAETLIDAVTTRDDAVTFNGPVPFVPMWAGLA